MYNKLFSYFIILSGLFACTERPDADDDQALKAVIDSAFVFAEKHSVLMAEEYKDQQGRLPRTYENGKDVSSDSRWWCSGFFPGSLWYIYENSQNPAVLKYAELYTDRVERKKYTTDNHDVGFMIYCSFGNGY